VTVKDIAAELGVSPMTVSNAYNRPDQLSDALRQRVLETAARLGYAGPSRAGRDLRLGGQRTIGVVYDTPLAYAVRDAAAAAFLGGVAAVAGKAEHHLLLLATADPVAATRGADGLIVYSVADGDPVLAATLDRRLPFVVVDQPRVPDAPFVGANDRRGAREAAAHLVELGHRRVAILAFGHGDPWPLADAERRAALPYAVTRERLAGYKDALRAGGVDPANVPVHEAPGPDADAARVAAEAILRSDLGPTAVLAMSDDLAFAVVDAAALAGVDVPGELSVTGFDDVPASARTRPEITTVRQDHDRKGRLAAELLLARLRGEPPMSPQRLRARLVVRASTAPPPGGGARTLEREDR